MAVPVTEALRSIQENGAYILFQSEVGSRLTEFHRAGLPIFTPQGFEFLAENSLDIHELREIAETVLNRPYWAFTKCYSDVLPRGYTYSFHAGPTLRSLVFQLCSPGSTVILHERSHLHTMKEEDIDKDMSDDWGLIVVRDTRLENLDMVKREITLEQGGIIIMDSRLRFTVVKGFVICVGHVSQDARLPTIAFPRSKEFVETVDRLERRGYRINYKWDVDS